MKLIVMQFFAAPRHLYLLLQQFTVSAVATMATVTAGMTLGFSAVALPAMQSTNQHPHVSEEQASWIGKCCKSLLTGATALKNPD
jgi:hypothetical protein